MATKIRKQFLLDPEKLRKAREYLRAKTDTETVERALDAVGINAEIDAAHAEFVMGEGEILDVYGRLDE
jgi:hypothetical protein